MAADPAKLPALEVGGGLEASPRRPPWRDALGRVRRSRLAVAGLAIILSLAFTAIFAPVIASQHPDENGTWRETDMSNREAPPSTEHLLGTDQLGRDMLSRMVYGARVSLTIGLFSVSLAILAGTMLGATAGYFGGAWDMLVMRLMDIMLGFPSILLALGIVVLIGEGLINVMLAVGIISVPTYARIVRASVLGEKNRAYVEASRVLGAGPVRILGRHVLPNALAPLIVAGSLGIGSAILDAAGLGFLGLGAQPPLAEWGLMLSDTRQKLFTAPWLVAFPGVAIMLTVLGFNLLGDGLRDVLDPRLRGR